MDISQVKNKVTEKIKDLKKMAISLTKGQNISLTKEAPKMTKMIVGLGWDANTFDGHTFDLDASAILLATNGKVRNDDDFIFYSHPQAANGSVVHTGDNLTGEGEGDDEQIIIELPKIDATVSKIVIPVSIYSAKSKGLNFGMVQNAFIRIVNADNNREVVRYDLTEDYSTETALVFAELYRHNNEWKVKAIGQGFNDGLGGIGRSYGLPLEDEK